MRPILLSSSFHPPVHRTLTRRFRTPTTKFSNFFLGRLAYVRFALTVQVVVPQSSSLRVGITKARGALIMLPVERVAYSAITDRPRLSLPGARLVVWVIVNVEDWNPSEPMPRTVLPPPAGSSAIPDVPNWAWHEYGNRVGFWRFVEVFDQLKIPVALAINGSAIQAYEPVARAALQRRWEFIGHGFSQKNMQRVPDERADIVRTTDVIREFTGRAPRGWLGPGLTETWDTPDILAEVGYEYVCDWVLDDQPVMLKTRSRPLVSVP